MQCGGKSSKMLKDGCKYCPPKGRVTAGGTPTYRVAGVEGVDWFASMEEVLRYMKACERKGAAFPSTRGKDEPPINWVGEAMQAEARAAKEEAARGARESAALLLAEQDAGLAAGVDGRQVAAALADWEEQERAEEARTGYMSIFSLAREGDTQVLNVFLEGDSGLLEARKETKHPDAGATPLLCAARAGQLETVRKEGRGRWRVKG